MAIRKQFMHIKHICFTVVVIEFTTATYFLDSRWVPNYFKELDKFHNGLMLFLQFSIQHDFLDCDLHLSIHYMTFENSETKKLWKNNLVYLLASLGTRRFASGWELYMGATHTHTHMHSFQWPVSSVTSSTTIGQPML